MTKFSITKNGNPLSKKLYTWDEKTKTFSSDEDELVLDFTDIDGVTFKTGTYCTFLTGPDCVFNTGADCTFKTGSYCTFNTGSYCTFNTGFSCTFITGPSCAFITGPSCIFEVGENCYLICYDVKGGTEIPVNKKIKLNGQKIAGYTVIEEKKETPSCDGKVVEIDGKQYKLTEIKK
jgi:hypothetical protein